MVIIRGDRVDSPDGMHLSYDRMASFLAAYGNPAALKVCGRSGQQSRLTSLIAILEDVHAHGVESLRDALGF